MIKINIGTAATASSSTAIKHQSDDDDGKHKNAMRYLEQYPDLSTKQIRRSKA